MRKVFSWKNIIITAYLGDGIAYVSSQYRSQERIINCNRSGEQGVIIGKELILFGEMVEIY